jgi:hypothetical protein
VLEVYKRTLLSPEVPRRGDRAVIVQDHHRTETGMRVRVVNDPHFVKQTCGECGNDLLDWFVEVEPDEGHEVVGQAGPYYYPIRWLRRVLPLN